MSKDSYYDNTDHYGRYTSIEQFKSQFTGVWGPSKDLWTAIDFTYGEKGYRMDTGRIYGTEPEETADGKKALFYTYTKRDKYETIDDDDKHPLYIFDSCYATIDDVLKHFEIDGKKLKDIILEDDFGIVEKG